MNLTPILVFFVILIISIKLLLDLKKGKISLKKFFLWLIIWESLGIIVFFPNIIVELSNIVGIERAKDLPIYVSIIILFYIVFNIAIKLEKIEQEITTLVRKITIKLGAKNEK